MDDSRAGDLHRIVLDQTWAGAAIPVLLFTTGTLALGAAGEASAGDAPTGAEHDPSRVQQIASDLGIDLARLDLFSTDAYRVQTALGSLTLPDSE